MRQRYVSGDPSGSKLASPRRNAARSTGAERHRLIGQQGGRRRVAVVRHHGDFARRAVDLPIVDDEPQAIRARHVGDEGRLDQCPAVENRGAAGRSRHQRPAKRQKIAIEVEAAASIGCDTRADAHRLRPPRHRDRGAIGEHVDDDVGRRHTLQQTAKRGRDAEIELRRCGLVQGHRERKAAITGDLVAIRAVVLQDAQSSAWMRPGRTDTLQVHAAGDQRRVADIGGKANDARLTDTDLCGLGRRQRHGARRHLGGRGQRDHGKHRERDVCETH